MKYLLLLLTAAPLLGQVGVCWVAVGGLGTGAGCQNVAGQNPNQSQYVTAINSAITDMSNKMRSLPQPPPKIGGENSAGSASYRNADNPNCRQPIPNTCYYSTATPGANSQGLDAWTDSTIVDASSKYEDWNGDALYWTQDSGYTGSARPANPPWMAYQLSVDKAHFAHIKSVLGNNNIRVSVAYLSNTFTACGLTLGSMTVAQVEACAEPMIVAEVKYLLSMGLTPFNYTPYHEVQGSFGNAAQQVFDPADWTTLIVHACNTIHTIPGANGIPCGGGFTANDGAWLTYYAANAGAAVQNGGFDVYNGVNPATWSTTLDTYGSMCAQLTAKGYGCVVNESDPARDVPSTAPSGSEQYAYFGCAAQIWNDNNLNNAYAYYFPRRMSSLGFTYVTRFSTQPFGGTDPVATHNCFNSDPTTGSTAYVIQRLAGTTSAGTGWGANTNVVGSWQGFTHITGFTTF